MFCNNCGTENPDGARFCSNCGAVVVAAEPKIEPKPDPTSITDLLKGFVKAERPLGTKLIMALIAGYYSLIGTFLVGAGLVGGLGMLFGLLDSPWRVILFFIFMGFTMVCASISVLRFEPCAWIWALVVAALVLFLPGSIDWELLAVNVVIMLYLCYMEVRHAQPGREHHE